MTLFREYSCRYHPGYIRRVKRRQFIAAVARAMVSIAEDLTAALACLLLGVLIAVLAVIVL